MIDQDDSDYFKDVRNDWVEITSLMTEIFQVPVALIAKKFTSTIEVYAITSKDERCLLKLGEHHNITSGLFSEEVLACKKDYLHVEDATLDPDWADSPTVKCGVVAYLGMPLYQPDGALFGVICLMDSKKNAFSGYGIRLLECFKKLVEADMRKVHLNRKLLEKKDELIESKDAALKEIIKLASDMKRDLSRNMTLNLNKNIIPIINELNSKCTSPEQHCKFHLDLVKSYVEDACSDFNYQVSKIEDRLTLMEVKVCNMLRQGMLHKDIAFVLSISPNTVKNHVQNIKRKLQINDKKISLKEYLMQWEPVQKTNN